MPPIANAPKGKAVTPEFKAPDTDVKGDAQGDANNPVDDTAKDSAVDNTAATLPQNAPEPADEEYMFIRMPDGKVRAIRKTDVQDMSASDVENPNVPEQEVYVHLADGSVERVKESKLPGPAGTNAAHGYFERDGKNYHIIGVHPVETDVAK